MNLEAINTTNVVTIVGWLVTFGLGLVSALLVQRYSKARKKLTWSVVSESNLLARDALDQLQSGFGVPVQVLINGEPQTELSTIRIRIASESNVEVQPVKLFINFGVNALVHVGKYVGDSSAYGKMLTLTRHADRAELSVNHINPSENFDVEFLVANYQCGNVVVDMAEPGVTLRLAKLQQGVPLLARAPVAIAVAVVLLTMLLTLINSLFLAEVRSTLIERDQMQASPVR